MGRRQAREGAVSDTAGSIDGGRSGGASYPGVTLLSSTTVLHTSGPSGSAHATLLCLARVGEVCVRVGAAAVQCIYGSTALAIS